MRISEELYKKEYQDSILNPEKFWDQKAKKFIHWFKPWDTVQTGNFTEGNVRWFSGATLNASYNCLDRHLKNKAHNIAIIWESDNGQDSIKLTYQELFNQVCLFSNVLKKYGIKKGDRVCIYLPMIPEAAVAMLACARIGAIHSVVFGGFSAESLKSRINDADCKLVITANEGIRGGKIIPLKNNVDLALENNKNVNHVIVIKRTENINLFKAPRDIWYHEAMQLVSHDCPAEEMEANDPLFILYTSGSTGKPKGILHGTGGYLLYTTMSFQCVFDYSDQDIFWCTADIGWITGHSYGIYGPLSSGATIVMFEGVPHYPTYARYWEIIDKYKITIFYTAPTAIRALRREGDVWVSQTERKSLRLLGSVGEPINPEAWEWYFDVVGDARCPIVDTWWQTETGGILISPLPYATPLKAGAAAWPFFGITPNTLEDGRLVITTPWPGMMQSIYGDHERFMKTYFSEVPGQYLTGDQAFCDEEGYYWIRGRSDDVIKVSGHRIGTQEVESALILQPAVAEAAVVGVEDDIKGQHIYAFVTLKIGKEASDALEIELKNVVRHEIGAIAVPEQIQFTEALPKTRSGKILRRLLRKIANKDTQDLGDLSTLADPTVVEQLLK